MKQKVGHDKLLFKAEHVELSMEEMDAEEMVLDSGLRFRPEETLAMYWDGAKDLLLAVCGTCIPRCWTRDTLQDLPGVFV